MGILTKLIEDTVDSSVDLSQVLRRATVLSTQIGSAELADWAESELNGYHNDSNIPAYRITKAASFGNFIGVTHKFNNAPIPLGNIDKDYRVHLEKLIIRGGVADLQEQLRSTQDFVEQWSPDFVSVVSDRFYSDMTLMRAWKQIPKPFVAQVLDSVRNRLLEFLLDLKARYPEIETDGEDLSVLPRETVRASVVNNIYGGTNVFATGEEVQQDIAQSIMPHDTEGLLGKMRALSIPDDLVNELSGAIKSEKPQEMGSRISKWISRVAERVSADVAVAVTKDISQYFGI